MKYNCNICSFHTNYKSVFDKHMLCDRHKIMSSNESEMYYNCIKCKKKYKTSSGLWKHGKKCAVLLPEDCKEEKTLLETVTEIKTMMEYINMERDELIKIIEDAHTFLQQKSSEKI